MKNEMQMSFAEFGVVEQATPLVKKRAKKTTATADSRALTESLKNLLSQAESLGFALQEKYDANMTAHRPQPRVGISVDVEDIESLLLAISDANKALNSAN